VDRDESERGQFPISTGIPQWPEWLDPEFRPVSFSTRNRLLESGRIEKEFDAIVDRHPNRIAVVGSRTLTYRELQNHSLCAAKSLLAILESYGLKRPFGRNGLIVGILANNDWQNLAAVLAVLRIGATCCLISPKENAKGIFSRMPPTGDFLLLADRNLSAWIEDYRSTDQSHSPHILFFDDLFARERIEAIPSQSDLQTSLQTHHDNTSTSPAFLFFTSGSTGEPKGVMMSHSFVLLDIARQINDLAVRPSDRIDLLFSPNFSAFLAPTFLSLLSGASCWIRSWDSFPPNDLSVWLSQSQITISTMSPSLMRGVLEQFPPGSNWPSLRILSVGGEPLTEHDVELFRDRTYPTSILQNAMAATETRTFAQFFIPHGISICDPIPTGYPVYERYVQILDEHGNQLGPNEVGQIRIKSPHLADGYWPVCEEQQTHFSQTDSDMQYLSSDLGYFDQNGLLYCAGRKDSMVKIRGQKVLLNQVESELTKIPGITNAVAFCLSNSLSSPTIAAIVESKQSIEPEQIRFALARHLHEVAIPSLIACSPEFPRTATGKIHRIEVQRDFELQFEQSKSAIRPTTGNDPVLQFLSDFFGENIQPEARLANLAIDSLRALELGIKVASQFGKYINGEDIESCTTAIELANRIRIAPVSQPIRTLRQGKVGALQLILISSIVGSADRFAPLLKNLLDGPMKHSDLGIHAVEADRLRLPPNTPSTIANFADLILHATIAKLEEFKDSRVALAGYSWGGLLAYELTSRLQAAGYRIDHLVLIDSVIRRGAPKSPFGRLLRTMINLPNWLRTDAMEMTPSEWILELKKKWRRSVLGLHNDLNAPSDSLYSQQFCAAVDFDPTNPSGTSLPQKTTVIRASTQSLSNPVFGALGWEPYIQPPPKVLVVPGNHLSILEPDRSRHLAEALREALCDLSTIPSES
jgi:acyl-coenzyme A synthetase/AMP-(fatty) acid ligase/thioesterase domain-containing protein/acyl carrier protein